MPAARGPPPARCWSGPISIRPRAARAGIDLHGCRWDQALALARLSWGGRPPARIDAILVEGASFVPGDGLSEAVRRGVERAAARILALLAGVPGPGGG